jgi:hypothetical protein
MREDYRAFEILERAAKYIVPPNEKVANLYKEIGRGLRSINHTKWRLSYTRAKTFTPE